MKFILTGLTLLLISFSLSASYSCTSNYAKNSLPYYVIDDDYQIGNLDRRGHVSLINFKLDKTRITIDATFSVSNGKRSYKIKLDDIYWTNGKDKIALDTTKYKRNHLIFGKRASYQDITLEFKVPAKFAPKNWTLVIGGLKFKYK